MSIEKNNSQTVVKQISQQSWNSSPYTINEKKPRNTWRLWFFEMKILLMVFRFN